MKVCIPTMGDRGLAEAISPHFGRGAGFTFVDTDTNEVKIVDNTGEHGGGAGLTPGQIIVQEGADAVLCSGLGRRAIMIFEQNGVEVFTGATGTVEDAIKAWEGSSLKGATDADACAEHKFRRL